MLEAFQSVYDYLIKKNFKPKLHVMDNECSKVIKTFIENKKMSPYNLQSPTNTGLMQLIGASKHSKIILFLDYAPSTNFSLCNFGVNCCNKLKSALTCYNHRAKTQNYQRTLSLKQNSTLTKPHQPHRAQKHSFSPTQKQ